LATPPRLARADLNNLPAASVFDVVDEGGRLASAYSH
jgi:hypothetical protein